MSIIETASALLSITKDTRERAAKHVVAFKRIKAQLGDGVAMWAYADKGNGPGLRGPCLTGSELAKWKPSHGNWCIVLAGVQGTGKSITAARYVAERGGLLVSATDADKWGFGGGRRLTEAVDAQWLLLDDMGESRTTPGTANICTLIADRYAYRRRTVITTVLTPDEIAARFGDNVGDRLRPHVVELFDRETASRRSDVAPILTGFQREAEIHQWAERVRLVAHGVEHDHERAQEAVARLADLTGVDLQGEPVAAAVKAQAEHRSEMERMAADFLAELDATIKASEQRITSEREERSANAMAWIDSLDMSEVEVAQ